jgi:hypothetical protein
MARRLSFPMSRKGAPHAPTTGPLAATTAFAGVRRWERAAVGAIIALFLIIGLAYSLVVPPFETPDEVFHYAFVRHLAEGGALPDQTREANGPWAHEGTQAPLYYFLAGRLTAGIDQSDFDQISQPNLHANLGDPLSPGNKNYMLYSAYPWPLRGTNLALHIVRWFSLCLAGLSLWLFYRTARLAFPRSPALRLLALLIAATLPQFAFISAAGTNDNMAILMSAATVYWLARLVARPDDQPIAGWEWGVLGVLLGLAALSKLQVLGLFGLAAVTGLWLAVRRRSWTLPLVALPWVALPALAIAGWWYWRNHALYGDWLGVRTLLTINGERTTPQTLGNLRGELRGLRYSFWGLFGWFSILLPAWIYRVLDAISVLALIGLPVAGWTSYRSRNDPQEREGRRVIILLAGWAVLLIGLMLYWATFATSSQGRLLFPGLSAFAVLFTVGLASLIGATRRPTRAAMLALLPIGLLATSIYSLTVLLPISYHAPTPIAALPAGAQPLHIAYAAGPELIGVDVAPGRYHGGDRVPVTLYWRTPRRLTDNIPLFVQLLDDQGRVIGNVTTQAGWGRNPTSLWQPGVIYPDPYTVPVQANLSDLSPLLARVYVGLMDPVTRQPLPGASADGALAAGMVGQVEIATVRPLDANALNLTQLDAGFGAPEELRLTGYRYTSGPLSAGDQISGTLLWEARRQPAANYTAFVHLLDAAGKQVAGFDQPPAAERFPTSRWQPGDRSRNDFRFSLPADLPPGVYQLWAGLYQSDTPAHERIPVTANPPADHAVRDQMVLLGSIETR